MLQNIINEKQNWRKNETDTEKIYENNNRRRSSYNISEVAAMEHMMTKKRWVQNPRILKNIVRGTNVPNTRRSMFKMWKFFFWRHKCMNQ